MGLPSCLHLHLSSMRKAYEQNHRSSVLATSFVQTVLEAKRIYGLSCSMMSFCNANERVRLRYLSCRLQRPGRLLCPISRVKQNMQVWDVEIRPQSLEI